MKEVKLKMQARDLLRLQSMKLLHGRTFSDMVTHALSDYFESRGMPLDPMPIN